MIDVEATIEKFGYDPNTLKPKSNRMVVNTCPVCGTSKDIHKFTTAREGWNGLCSTCSPKTERRRRIRSDAMLGNKIANTHGERNYFYGKHFIGADNPNWKGGITSESELIRSSQEYRDWRISVFDRDDYTCQECNDSTGGNLNAHHILPRRDYPDMVLDINNGITLCEKCHTKTYRKEHQFVDKYTDIVNMRLFAQECAFINRVNCWDISSETISSQAYPVMDLKVQRLTPDTQDGCVMETRVPYIQMDDDIVRACMRMQEVPDKELDR